jgi:hypothetical protein
MDRKLGMHESLVAGISLRNFTHMPFTYMGGVIACIPEHLREQDLFAG